MSRPPLSFLKASLFFWHRRKLKHCLYPIQHWYIWDLLYCLGSLLPRKHLADKALQRVVKRHVSTIAAHSSITAGSLSSRSPSPRDTVGSTALRGRCDWFFFKDAIGRYWSLLPQIIEKSDFQILTAKILLLPMQRLVWHSGQWYLVFLLRIRPLPSVVFQQKLQERAGPSLAWENSFVEETDPR